MMGWPLFRSILSYLLLVLLVFVPVLSAFVFILMLSLLSVLLDVFFTLSGHMFPFRRILTHVFHS